MKLWRIATLSLVMLLGACATLEPKQTTLEPQANYWQQVGGQVGSVGGDGQKVSLASDGTTYTVAFSEDISGTKYIRVRRWTGTIWTNIGNPVDASSAENSDASSPSLAVDPSGNPVVSWQEWDGTSTNIYVKRWNGSSWVQLGTILDTNTNQIAANPSLAVDSSGNPVVSWYEFGGKTYVKRWNGSSWVQLGNPLNGGGSLALDNSGNPVVALRNRPCDLIGICSSNIILYVNRWDGNSWVDLGSLNVSSRDALSASLAINASGQPLVSWYECNFLFGSACLEYNFYVKRWDGSTWVQLGTHLNVNFYSSAHDRSLAVDASGNPVVSLLEAKNIYVKRWNGSNWILVGANPLNTAAENNAYYPSLSLVAGQLAVAWRESPSESAQGPIYVKQYLSNAWQDIGGTVSTSSGNKNNAATSSIARKSNNNPVVAVDKRTGLLGPFSVYVHEWNGTTWNTLGGALNRIAGSALNPSLAMRSNQPVVAFQETNHVYVSRWNGSAWINVGTALDTVLANEAITPSLAIETTSNLPVVAFAESGNIRLKRANGVGATSVWQSPYGVTPLDTSVANTAYRPSLALKSNNQPIIAWYETVGTNQNIYVKEWTGTSWVALGAAIDVTASQNAKDIVLAIRSDNRPVVAWEEVGSIYVKRWNGASWVSVGGVLDKVATNTATRPAIDLRSDDNPVVTWQEVNGSNNDVVVKRWNGTNWVQVTTTPVDKNVLKQAGRPSLVLKSNGNPMVSWSEYDTLTGQVFVRQY